MKFYLHNFSNFKGKLFSVSYLRQLFISLALRKCKKDFKILKIILAPDFCPLRTEIARFPIGSRLKLYWLNPSQTTTSMRKAIIKRMSALVQVAPIMASELIW